MTINGKRNKDTNKNKNKKYNAGWDWEKSKQQKNMIGIYKNMYIYLEGESMKEFLDSINIKYIVTGGVVIQHVVPASVLSAYCLGDKNYIGN